MKKLIKKTILKILKPVNTRLGFQIHPIEDQYIHTSKNSLLDTFFSNLKELDFKPRHIIDIGANHGTWTREALKFFPDASYTLFEPQFWLKKSFEDLLEQNEDIRFYAMGLGEKRGNFKFTIVDRDDSCSFRYSEEDAKLKGFRQVDLPVCSLNDLIKEEKLPVPDIIKIDAEGLDLEVLKGADNLFGKSEVFMVEASINHKALKNNLLRVIHFMNDNGYRLFDITDINRPFTFKVLWLTELAFIKKDGQIDRSFDQWNIAREARKISVY